MVDVFAPVIHASFAVRIHGTVNYGDTPDEIFWFDCDRCGEAHNHAAVEGHLSFKDVSEVGDINGHTCAHYPFGYILKERPDGLKFSAFSKQFHSEKGSDD